MPRRLVIYKRQDVISESANLLADSFENSLKVRRDGNYNPKVNDLILCWGCSEAPNWSNKLNGAKVINHWSKLAVSTNKLRTFEVWRPGGIKVPDWTTDIAVARTWIANKNVVMARQILNGSQGDGIIVCKTLEELNAAPNIKVFTKYFVGAREYRIFVLGGMVIDYIQKKRKAGYEGPRNQYIKNVANGYIYAHNDVYVPQNILEHCVKSAQVLGLEFAAIDVKWSNTGEFVILEANSSPGCTEGGQSTERIIAGLRQLLNNQPVTGLPIQNPPVNAPAPPVAAPAQNAVPTTGRK